MFSCTDWVSPPPPPLSDESTIRSPTRGLSSTGARAPSRGGLPLPQPGPPGHHHVGFLFWFGNTSVCGTCFGWGSEMGHQGRTHRQRSKMYIYIYVMGRNFNSAAVEALVSITALQYLNITILSRPASDVGNHDLGSGKGDASKVTGRVEWERDPSPVRLLIPSVVQVNKAAGRT